MTIEGEILSENGLFGVHGMSSKGIICSTNESLEAVLFTGFITGYSPIIVEDISDQTKQVGGRVTIVNDGGSMLSTKGALEVGTVTVGKRMGTRLSIAKGEKVQVEIGDLSNNVVIEFKHN